MIKANLTWKNGPKHIFDFSSKCRYFSMAQRKMLTLSFTETLFFARSDLILRMLHYDGLIVILVHPVHDPKKQNPEWTRSRMVTIQNNHNPEWSRSGMDTSSNDTSSNGHQFEWTPSRMDSIPTEDHPDWIPFRMDIILNGLNPEWTPFRMSTSFISYSYFAVLNLLLGKISFTKTRI